MRAFTNGSSILEIVPASGSLAGLSSSSIVPIGAIDVVLHARHRGDEVEIELALEPLLHDLHVQQPEKAAAEAEAESGGCFGLVVERGIVELKLFERVAESLVLRGVRGIESREHHRVDILVAGQGLPRRVALGGERVADAQAADVLQARDHVADLTGAERLGGAHRRREEADLLRLEARPLRHRPQRLDIGLGRIEHRVTRARFLHRAHVGDDEADFAGPEGVGFDLAQLIVADLRHLVRLPRSGGEANLHPGLEHAVDHAHTRHCAAIAIVVRVVDQRA